MSEPKFTDARGETLRAEALRAVADGRWRDVTAGMLEILYLMKLIDARYNLTDLGRAALAAARKETP